MSKSVPVSDVVTQAKQMTEDTSWGGIGVLPVPVERSPQGLQRRAQPWRNWAGNQRCAPLSRWRPTTEAGLVDAVRAGLQSGGVIRAVGSGHSFTATACTDGCLLDLSHYNRLLSLDADTGDATVQAGMTLRALGKALAAEGRALASLGDIDSQSVAGALSTGTHGTGANVRCLSSGLVAASLITSDGELRHLHEADDPELMRFARVGLGALGVLSTLTLKTVPAFQLKAHVAPREIDELLDDIDACVDGNEHFEFFWFPGSRWTLAKGLNRTTEPLAPRGRLSRWANDMLMENYALDLLCVLEKWFPGATRLCSLGISSSGVKEYIEPSHVAFVTPRTVRFLELEFALPRSSFVEVFRRFQELVEVHPMPSYLPVECRWNAADDIPLSPAYGRDTVWISVHAHQRLDFEPYLRAVDQLMREYGGRPHWGKVHYHSAAELAPLYPEWKAFQDARRQLDPGGCFANSYTRRVLG